MILIISGYDLDGLGYTVFARNYKGYGSIYTITMALTVAQHA